MSWTRRPLAECVPEQEERECTGLPRMRFRDSPTTLVTPKSDYFGRQSLHTQECFSLVRFERTHALVRFFHIICLIPLCRKVWCNSLKHLIPPRRYLTKGGVDCSAPRHDLLQQSLYGSLCGGSFHISRILFVHISTRDVPLTPNI